MAGHHSCVAAPTVSPIVLFVMEYRTVFLAEMSRTVISRIVVKHGGTPGTMIVGCTPYVSN